MNKIEIFPKQKNCFVCKLLLIKFYSRTACICIFFKSHLLFNIRQANACENSCIICKGFEKSFYENETSALFSFGLTGNEFGLRTCIEAVSDEARSKIRKRSLIADIRERTFNSKHPTASTRNVH